MRYKNSNIKKNRVTKTIAQYTVFFLFCLLPLRGRCQTGGSTVDTLVAMGFENVGWTEDGDERVYVLQNSAYRLQGVGVGQAIDVIQRMGLPVGKPCRIIVLDNNVPQLSLFYNPVAEVGAVAVAQRKDWQVSHELGGAWKKVRKVAKVNSSLFKVDVVVYPRLMFQNYRLSRVYDLVLNASPAIEVSFWKGMKFTGQVIFPIVNDYGKRYEQIRPGFVTLSQTLRLPHRVFLTATIGFFEDFRSGVDVSAKHVFKNEHFWLKARLGYTRKGYWENWSYYHGAKWTLNGYAGINYFWSRFNTQFSLKGERYLLGEYGMSTEMIRHFRHASIGFYALKVFGKDDAANNGFNAGFTFRISLPPYKYTRKGAIPRVVGGDWGIRYNAGNEKQYGDWYQSSPSDNYLRDNSFNPYFIKSELLNF